MTEVIRVGWVNIFSGLNITGQRPNEEKLGIDSSEQRFQQQKDSRVNWEGLPYSTGLLQAYAEQHLSNPSNYEFSLPVYRNLPVDEACEQLMGNDIVGFSTYVWNIRRCLAIAERLKERQPETLIVFGGPQVPDRAEAFLRESECVDIAVHGEGEQVFLQLLENFSERDWSAIPSVSFLDSGGAFVNHTKADRISNLGSIPSPYLSGVFALLIEANPDTLWFTMMETNRGCPFACTFCDWGSAIASKVRQFPMERVTAEFDWMAENRVEYIFCCDANFGMLPRDLDIAQHVGALKQRTGYPVVFATQATKNATDRSYQVQSAMAQADIQGGVTISYQSVDPETLRLVKRDNISVESFSELQYRYVRDGVPTYTDMILALPGETLESYVRGLDQVISSGQNNKVAFYNCAVLPNAEMGDPEYQKTHGLETVSQRIIELHSSIRDTENEEVPEYIDIVVSTNAMPLADWQRAKVSAWWLEMLYFDRVFQIPLLIARTHFQTPGRVLIQQILDSNAEHYPVLASLNEKLWQQAEAISRGEPELYASEAYLGCWWPMDQLLLIDLVKNWQLDAFYVELEALFGEYFQKNNVTFTPALWADAVTVNKQLLRRPFMFRDGSFNLDYPIWQYYDAVVSGQPVEQLQAGACTYNVICTQPTFRNLDDWCEYLILCQNYKAGYLYPIFDSSVAEAV